MFPSLAIPVVTKDSQQTQRRLKPWREWKFLKMCKLWEGFLELNNYLNHFSPRLAELSDPLRESADRKWNSSLQKLVRLPFNAGRRKFPYFNLKAPTILQTDASKWGNGAVLLQNSTPVMFASRSLTGVRKLPEPWERMPSDHLRNGKVPLLPVWKGIYLGDRSQALVLIYKKHMVEISPRIQRLMVRSFPYQPFHIRYRKGVEIPTGRHSE